METDKETEKEKMSVRGRRSGNGEKAFLEKDIKDIKLKHLAYKVKQMKKCGTITSLTSHIQKC